jgi:hypothetical protein
MAIAAQASQPVAVTNLFSGRAKLVAGTIAVAFAGLLDTSEVFVTGLSGNTGFMTVTQTTGTGFTVTSSQGGDAGFVNWLVIQRYS